LVELLANQRVIGQLLRLERRTGRGNNKDVIDHPRGEHDDLANSVAGALTMIGAEKRTPMAIDPSVLLRSRYPASIQHLFHTSFVSHFD
jgi:hypothetical protein